ncbi:MAG: ABC transporter permease [Longimicrobiales bacterium]|nr:ABC transporter permease [Longimicrobiales bacterium]
MRGVLPGGTEPERPEEIDAEIRFHIEQRIERLIEEGWSGDAARAEALRRFGDVERARSAMKREDRLRRWTMRWRDLRDAVRLDARNTITQWRRAPGIFAMALLTLALGIGATTAIFSVVDAVLLRPLPFPAPDRLVAVWSDWTERGGPEREWFGWPDLVDVREEVGAFEEVGIWGGGTRTLTGRGSPVQVSGIVATEGTLSRVLRVRPELGRFFTPEEDVAGGPAAVVISHEFWQRALGGDAEVIGSSLVLDGEPHEVIGVIPPGVAPPFGPATVQDVWVTPRVDHAAVANTRGNASWRAIARLHPGVSLAAANEELHALGIAQREAWPGRYEGQIPVAHGLHDDLTRASAPGMRLVLGAVGLVLLLTSFNVGNLLLARISMRRGELAIRAALGAGRRRLARQLLTEAGVLSVAGGLAGILVGSVGIRLLVALAPQGTPRIETASLDGRVLAFAALVTLASAVLAGVVPALRASRRDPKSALAGRGGELDRGGFRLRSTLVAGQVAIAVTLLAGAGLLGRSFQQLRSVDLGFEPTDVMTFRVSLPGVAYDDADARAVFQNELADRLRALPGVTEVGAVSALPLVGFDSDVTYTIEGRPPPEPGEETAAWIRRVIPGYMEAMDLEVIAGRGITPSDARGAQPVLVINETLAEARFPGEDPIGQRIHLGSTAFEIVGIAADVRNFAIRDDWRDAVYFSNLQFPGRTLFFTVEMAPEQEPASVLPGARNVLAELDASLAVIAPAPMRDLVEGALGPDRFLAVLLGSFATLALVLAVVGLYGVVSHAVAARMREVGVRMALGADATQIRRLLLMRGFAPVAAGILGGLVVTWGATRFTQALLFETSTADPVSIGGAVALLAGAALLATLAPALRAARADPARILREE